MMFEVPESYSKHYLDLPALPEDGLPARALRAFADPLATGRSRLGNRARHQSQHVEIHSTFAPCFQESLLTLARVV
jgi:hypothetical protein